MFGKDRMSDETFDVVASKLQEELIDIFKNNKEVNDYELIVTNTFSSASLRFHYLRIWELKLMKTHSFCT